MVSGLCSNHVEEREKMHASMQLRYWATHSFETGSCSAVENSSSRVDWGSVDHHTGVTCDNEDKEEMEDGMTSIRE